MFFVSNDQAQPCPSGERQKYTIMFDLGQIENQIRTEMLKIDFTPDRKKRKDEQVVPANLCLERL